MQIIANGLQIEVDIQGPEHGEPILLIMGLGMQLIGWPDELVQMLVQRGFRVIRHDNRDVGLSQGFDNLGVPNVMVEALRQRLRMRVRAPYQVADMAADALGVLDALGIEHAHICGASMGGMIAQHIAAKHPRRVKSLTLIMTTSGARSLKQAHPKVLRVLLSRPQTPDASTYTAHMKHVLSVIGSPAYPPDPQRLQQRAMASFSRAFRPAGTARQLVAVAADGDRSPLLHRIVAPTRVIHGEVDPLVPVPAAHDLVQKIPGAVADIVPGMGHDLPLPLLPRIAEGIVHNAARAAS
ncbi:MAG: alpha/beta fold hydrolase [Burkholderiaceae bacterium]|jgi:pimeloyl-ACP methyl ester carboxylesterase|nr:alpha/beta fold hydrolase [Burkholderiaceae bacterium]MCU0963949.1 alpha/beta fold hydrolase [Burkholderiaceae bacterium]